MELDVVFIPGIDPPFSATAFNDWEMGGGGSLEDPFVLNEEGDKENSPPTTPVSECPTELPMLLRCRPFGERI